MAKARVKIPSTIKGLRKEALDLYREVFREVIGKGPKEIDMFTISLLATEYDKYLEACDEIESKGITMDNHLGNTVINPAVTVQKQAFACMKQAWDALGITPEARKKLSQGAEPGKAKGKKRAKISTVKG